MALYSNPAVGKDTLLVSLLSKRTTLMTILLPDCPSSWGKTPNPAPFSSCSHRAILALLWSLQSVHILLNFWFSKLTTIFLLDFKVLGVITPCLHSSCSSYCVQEGNVYFFEGDHLLAHIQAYHRKYSVWRQNSGLPSSLWCELMSLHDGRAL